MKLKRWHLWWLLAPVVVAMILVGVQSFFHTRQKHAIETIQRLGGRVLTTHGEPAWLRRLAGKRSLQIFKQATVVNLRQTEIRDPELVHLEKLIGLERLNLSGTEITDDGLEHLEGLAELKALDLSETRISGQGLKHLQALDELEYLYLAGTKVSDGDLDLLFGFDNLRELDLTGTDVTADGIHNLNRELPDVRIEH